MVTHIRVNMTRVVLTARVSIHGSRPRFMMVSGREAPRQVTAFGRASMAKATSGSGSTAKLRGMECTSGVTATNTRVSGTGV